MANSYGGLYGGEDDAVRAQAANLAASQSGQTKAGLRGFIDNVGGKFSDFASAWCSAFTNTVYGAFGVANDQPDKLMAKSWLNLGTPVTADEAKPGDVIVYNRISPNSPHGHVGIVTKNYGDGELETVEGNTGGRGGRVRVGARSVDDGIGWGTAGLVRPDVPSYSAYGPAMTTPSEIGAGLRLIDRFKDFGNQFRDATDFGPPVWDGTSNKAPTLAAPIGAVSTSSLPDITPTTGYGDLGLRAGVESGYPSISSDNTGFQQGYPSISSDSTGGIGGMQTGGGFGGEGFTTGGGFSLGPSPSYPSISSDSTGFGNSSYPSISSDSTGGLTGMQTGGSFGGDGFTTGGGFGTPGPFASAFDPTPVANQAATFSGDLSQSAADGAFAQPLSQPTPTQPSVSPYGFSGLNTTPMASAANLQTPLAPATPAISSTWDVPSAPTADPYGMPPQTPAITSTATPETPAPDFKVDLPPDVPAPDFAQPKIAAPAPPVAPKIAPPTIKAAPRVVAPRAPSVSASSTDASEPSAAPRFSAPDFSTSFNNLYSSPMGKQQFMDRTGMNSQTLNALQNAYDNAGMLTGVAYSALQDAFSNPQTTATGWTSAAPAPVTSSSLPDIAQTPAASPAMGSWGQSNDVTGNWAQDTSSAASDARIGNMGGSFIDPLTGQRVNVNDPTSGWGGIGGIFSGWSGGFGDGGTNPGLR